MEQLLGLEGTRLGRYRLRHHLGEGGMAKVYLAYDEQMRRDVAIKIVEDGEADLLMRFQREVETIGSLTHEHILPVFDYGEQGRCRYLVMQHVEGGTLRERLDAGPLSRQEIGHILIQVASALQFAHERGIIHRDIKPSNILLRGSHYAYLADFGLAKPMDSVSNLTQTGCLMGTPEYMAPELADEEAGPGVDIYSLGVVLYQMLTGQVPFTGSTILAVYWKHLQEQPVPPSKLNPAVPSQIEQVVLRALEKDPRQRFQTPMELAQAYQLAFDAAQESQTLYGFKAPSSLRFPQFPRLRQGMRTILALLLTLVFLLATSVSLALFLFNTTSSAQRANVRSTGVQFHAHLSPISEPHRHATPTPTPTPRPTVTIKTISPRQRLTPTPTPTPTPTQGHKHRHQDGNE